MDRRLMLMEIFSPWRGVYDHNIQTSSSLKPLGQPNPNFIRSILGNDLIISIAYRQILYFFDENRTNVEIFDEINIVLKPSLYKWSRSHDQDGRHG